LCVDGATGAALVLTMLGTEFEAALAFCGATSVDELSRDLVTRAHASD
jgi:isopentenyl diphosphate isomerase/L-lactate dehydrogenase-like FMN-dependent dehydrogenase